MAADDGCTIVHVDMDAFFAAVAIRDRPDLRHVPVIVGGSDRGVVLSATYPARRYGIRSGMPGMRARRLCPHAVVVKPDFDEITTVSAAVLEVFRTVTSKVEPLSPDEAFLDVKGALRRFASPTDVGEYLRARIADEQRITCSVGVAATTQLAKIASRRAKPDGLVVVPRDAMTSFLHPLQVDDLWGVGEKTAAALNRLGLRTVGDLAHTPVDLLQRAFGPVAGRHLHTLAWGGDDRGVTPHRSLDEPERSMGHGETFGRDVDDPVVIERELLRLSSKLTARMRAAGVSGRTVTLTVRFHDFTTITRARTLRTYTHLTAEVHGTAVELFVALGLERARIRMIGVRVEGLVETAATARQLRLDERLPGWDEAERAVDQVTTKFGRSAIRRATLVSARRP